MKKINKKLTVLTCCYNEQDNILDLYTRVSNTLDPIISWELIYVDNVSTDNSEAIYRQLAKKDKRVKIVFMSRNDGTGQHSFLAGLHIASGDALVYLDGDIQDPPEIIPQFINKWLEGWDIVYGIREKRHESFIKRIFMFLFYRMFKYMAYINIPLDAGDFSLIDKKVINAIKIFKEQDLFFRGIRAMVGFKQIGIKYEREERKKGKSTNSFFRLFFWARKAIFNFSYRPLEWISFLASIITLLTILYLGYFVFITIFRRNAPQGFPTLVVIILFLGSIQLLSLSVIGDYLGRIFNEVKQRPRIIVREILNDKKNKNLLIQ